jgi:hypothetical protein
MHNYIHTQLRYDTPRSNIHPLRFPRGWPRRGMIIISEIGNKTFLTS